MLWYLERSRSAAEQFLVALDRALDQVREALERWPIYVAGTRRYVMLKFPYVLVYKLVQGDVYVHAVAHAKRKPAYWEERLSWKGAKRDQAKRGRAERRVAAGEVCAPHDCRSPRS